MVLSTYLFPKVLRYAKQSQLKEISFDTLQAKMFVHSLPTTYTPEGE